VSLLGIDIGTTGCKAAAFSEDGLCLGESYREYPRPDIPPERSELDSLQVWACVKEVVTQVTAGTKKDPVTAMCVSAMGETATPVSANRDILGNCILSSDTRGAEYVQTLKGKLAELDFYRINPNILAASYTFPKLAWLKDNEPDVYAGADKFLLWDGLVPFMLGCEPFTSFSHANRTLLFDIHREDWSDELLNATGIDRTKLARCLPGGAIAGVVSDNAATELGLPPDVKIVVGGHDQCCNALGAGIHEPGRAVDGIGTYECITPIYGHIPEARDMLASGLNVEHHVLPGMYVSFLFNQGGSLVRWFRDTFAGDLRNAPDVYDRLTAEIPEDPTRLLVLPYFEPTGSPGYIADASGVILGLKMNTTRGEIFKAIMESVTFYFTESIQALKRMGIDTSEFIATGGGAKSDAWLQIKADILGVPFVRPRITECGLLGTAILAGVSTGVFKTPAEGVEVFVKPDRVFEPDKERHTVYCERNGKFQKLYPLLRDYLASFQG
jgi:xylulokinase